MIIEVRTRTVGYKACVKNSLSFSTLPAKPSPRLKDTDRASAREADSMGAVPQPRGNHAPEQTNVSCGPILSPAPLLGFSDAGNGTFLFKAK